MIRLLNRLRRDERGIALMVALAAVVVLGIAVTAVISYSSSNQRSANLDQSELAASQIAEAGMQQAYSILTYQNSIGNDPSAANLLGCSGANGTSSDTTAPSNCSTGHTTKRVICVSAAAGCSAGDAGSATVFGCYIGTHDGHCTMDATSVAVTASNWLIWSTGYARNPNTNKVVSHTLKATASVTTDHYGLTSSVWNYLFSSAPPGNGCELDVNGQNVVIDVPLFVTGDFCLSGSNAGVAEGSQPIDLQVLGKTVFSGGGNYVGTSAAPITSGVSALGCAAAVTSTGTSCSSYPWHVKTTDPVPSQTPTAPTPNFTSTYSSAPIGPAHGCATSGTLATSKFDNNTTLDNSVSAFELTPSSSYSCVSNITNADGTTSSATLSWNATTKVLTVSGNIYIDGSAYVSQQATYSGQANLYLSGTFYFTGQTSGLCATTISSQKPYCDMSAGAWSTTTNMLLIMPDDLAGTTKAVALDGQNNFLQAGILAPATATISLGGNNVFYQGPIIGGKYTWGNNVSLKPLPPIANMPPGAPLDPNVSVKVGGLTYQ